MRPLLEAELIKLRTTRTFIALSAVAIGISLLLTILTASIGARRRSRAFSTTSFRTTQAPSSS